MSTRSKDVSNHDIATGRKYYDRTKPDFRSASMHVINSMEGSSEANYETDDVLDKDVARKRIKLDASEKEESKKLAKERLRSKAPRKTTVSSRCNMKRDHRQLIQDLFTVGGKFEESLSEFDHFPGNFDQQY